MLRLLVGVLCLVGCVAAVAFASVGRMPARIEPPGAPTGALRPVSLDRGLGSAPARPRITLHPAPVTVSTAATFKFRLRRHHRRFFCRIDQRRPRPCRSPLRLRNLNMGRHKFSVRALTRSGRRGPTARFRWEVVEPRPFDVAVDTDGLRLLYPGAPPVALPLTVTNPNPEPIKVVSLRALVTASPAGCDAAENLKLTESGTSEALPLQVPSGGTAELPAAGISAPTIQLRDLPTNQDACQGSRFELRFEGTAHG
jgi:hypothetical protein